jgi:uncharacterized pyridoxal phosphate-containing UPF0001 family protein
VITIKKYYYYSNKKLNNRHKKQKRANIFIQINIYNHAKKGGQNANQSGVIIKKYGKKIKKK